MKRGSYELQGIFDLVEKMREHQRNFFTFRKQFDLDESKRLEKIVDAEIKSQKEGCGLFD